MPRSIKRKSVLVTGCSTGIGFATALYFARLGWTVYAGVRNLHSHGSNQLINISNEERLELKTIKLDVTLVKDINNAISFISKDSGRINVLINNAGSGFYGPIESFSDKETISQFETNLFGALNLIREVAPIMRRSGGGHIINISGGITNLSVPFCGLYSSTKVALENISEVLRHELSPDNIHVVVVVPGANKTNFTGNIHYPDKINKNYLPRFNKFLKNYSKYRGLDSKVSTYDQKKTDRIPRLIMNIVQNKNPRFRYFIGTDVWLIWFARKLIPFSVLEKIISKVY